MPRGGKSSPATREAAYRVVDPVAVLHQTEPNCLTHVLGRGIVEPEAHAIKQTIWLNRSTNSFQAVWSPEAANASNSPWVACDKEAIGQ